jgi:hypothetical protein
MLAPLIVDSYNNANMMLFDAATGQRRVRIHPDAKPLINALASLVYKEGTNRPNKNSRWIHITDALKYALWEEFNVVTEVPQWGSSSSY